MKATFRGEVIAESDKTREVGGYVYFPREAVRMERLKSSPRTDEDKKCPNGVQFYDVGDSKRAAWSYEKVTYLKDIDHWVGFWNDVQISP